MKNNTTTTVKVGSIVTLNSSTDRVHRVTKVDEFGICTTPAGGQPQYQSRYGSFPLASWEVVTLATEEQLKLVGTWR